MREIGLLPRREAACVARVGERTPPRVSIQRDVSKICIRKVQQFLHGLRAKAFGLICEGGGFATAANGVCEAVKSRLRIRH